MVYIEVQYINIILLFIGAPAALLAANGGPTSCGKSCTYWYLYRACSGVDIKHSS